MAEYSNQTIREIEKKWQQKWEQDAVYKVERDPSKPKYYVLDMFPYPSGAGLHVGHPLGYIASDIVSRYKRIKGFNVLHPMGFDSFGLPAEQYAIQTGQDPAITTEKNIKRYIEQLKNLGFSFDWSREVRTSNPDFYKWTQWIFMQLFNSWYNQATDKTEPIQTLIDALGKSGSTNIKAARNEDTPAITAGEWSTLDEAGKEKYLQHYRIAYLSETMVNWCPALGTVLSNDEVKDGVSERGGHPVERLKMLQWSMRISAYAERLLTGLDKIDWPTAVKEMQRNWIGKSIGTELDFAMENGEGVIKVFTTRIDTIYGATFMVIAPEHELVEKITTDAQRKEVEAYVEVAKNRSERERMSEVKRVSGTFTGAYAINPFNKEKIPVWIADYVLAGYGTGAVMAVPGHDERDHRFAKQFGLPIVQVVEGPDVQEESFDSWDAKIMNSDFMNGMTVQEAIHAGIEKVEAWGIGKGKTNYRIRDAIFGRQRYWGEPFPVYFENELPKLVAKEHLPIVLPKVDAYKPTETGEPPLGRAKHWGYSKTKGGLQEETSETPYPFELTTMPGWAGSSWYWFRYMDAKNENEFCSHENEQYWKDVDLYMGGSEHATGHLLYSRFWCKALKDLGFVEADEPFKKLINQGHIQGVSEKVYFSGKDSGAIIDYSNTYFVNNQTISLSEACVAYYSADIIDFIKKNKPDSKLLTKISQKNVDISIVQDGVLDISKFNHHDDIEPILFCKTGYWRNKVFTNYDGETQHSDFTTKSEVEKMSKSKYNVVNPDDIIEKYGADTLRMYEMFLGPLEQSKPWNTNGIDGVFKFLRKFWNLFHDGNGNFSLSDTEPTRDELKVLHKTLKKIEDDIANFSFNTSVSEFMICTNALGGLKCNKRAILEPLVIALSPFAPHVAEELWQLLGHTNTISQATYPTVDEQYLTENAFEYPISVNGKVRAKMSFALDMPKEDIEKQVLAAEAIQKWTEGKTPKKVIIVQGRIVNLVM